MSKKHRKHEGRRLTRFELDAPAARRAFVAGTFNGWRPDATPMIWQDGGHWVADVDVPAGRHEYKFVVDGNWCYRSAPTVPPSKWRAASRTVWARPTAWSRWASEARPAPARVPRPQVRTVACGA